MAHCEVETVFVANWITRAFEVPRMLDPDELTSCQGVQCISNTFGELAGVELTL